MRILVLCTAYFAFSVQAADKPKIVLILADDMGCGDMGNLGTAYKDLKH